MKKLFTSTLLVLLGLITFAQTPQSFNYQAVLRDASGNTLANQDVEIEIKLIQDTVTNVSLFSETHSVTTNEFGLVNLQIGSVNSVEMETIDWSTGPYFIEVSVNGTLMGTSQLLSVPFAMHAVTVENDKVEDDDADPANELQQLAFENNELSISDGNVIDLSALINTKDTSATNELQQLALEGEQLTITEGNTVDLSSLANIKDTSVSNELQDISLSGTELSISNGSTVDLSVLQDGTGTDEQKLTFYGGNRYLTISNGNSVHLPFVLHEQDDDKTNELQALSISNDTIFISDGNEIVLPAETDPVYAVSVAAAITSADTTRWNRDTLATNELQRLSISNDTISLSDGNYIKLPVRSILADADNDTKIQVEERPDEDMLRVDIAGNETFTMNNSTGTTLQLPTNDDNSSLKIRNRGGQVVFGVDGRGLLNGDGSGLSNIKSLARTIGGNQRYQITANYGSYNAVRTVSFTAPSSGVCFVMASGYVDWESTGWDVLLTSILCDKDPNSSWSAEDEWYSYLNILTDYNCADSSDQYTSFAQHRCISVGPGTHNFYLWANKYISSSKTEVGDVNLTVLFFPTAGVGSAILKSTEIEEKEGSKELYDHSRPRNVDGSYSTIQTADEYKIKPPPENKLDKQEMIIHKMEERIEELEKRLELILPNKSE
ncbi:hypothetical protein [uncultured Draconibacterium sp.]|uniref:hypothetical protein n=1 Tax=uncultured Draconibacterium sp. TaxID=1573823 RepID=UPI002AA9320D|nr:hypothetical protein [uncultured Draconibacterium sp.]